MPRAHDALILALLYQLEDTQWWAQDALANVQFKQLRLLLLHTSHTVPYYKDRLLCVGDLRTRALEPDDWNAIPLLRRGDIQDAGDALYSNKIPKEHRPTGEVQSSGSTGRAVKVKTSRITGLKFAAINLRSHRWHKRDFTAKVARITRPLPGDKDEDKKPVGWVPAYPSGQMVDFDVSFTIEEQTAWLLEQKPDNLLTYPTNLKALLHHCQENKIRFSGLKDVSTLGEVLDPETRTLCHQVWGLMPNDAYSAQEVGMIALQCPDYPNHYHVQSESLLVEILNEDNTPCQPGQTGRIVVTDLHNFAMPLIRYELGDYAEVGDTCPCGRGLPVLNRILGRTRNRLVLPSGKKMWPVFTGVMARNFDCIKQLQLIQEDIGRFELKVVVTKPLTAKQKKQIHELLSKTLRHEFSLQFTYVDEIPRQANGKFEDFHSNIE